MRGNITLSSTEEEKREVLDRQNRTSRKYKNYKIFYYGITVIMILIVIFCILEMTGVTHISWYSRLR